MMSGRCPGVARIIAGSYTHKGSQMPIRPEKLAELTSIPVEAAQFILSPPADMSEQQLHSRLHELVPLTTNRRSWIWEIHKNCDQLIHQRLAAFTAAQAMTFASFSVLTIARFNAAPTMASGRLSLLDWARVWVVLFGIFLAAVGWLVTYPMFKRLNYLNQTFLFRDKIYRDYFDCIKWQERTWACETKKPTVFLYSIYNRFIPLWLPIAGGVFWLVFLCLLVFALSLQPAPPQPLVGLEKQPGQEHVCRYQEDNPQLVALGLNASKLPLCQ